MLKGLKPRDDFLSALKQIERGPGKKGNPINRWAMQLRGSLLASSYVATDLEAENCTHLAAQEQDTRLHRVAGEGILLAELRAAIAAIPQPNLDARVLGDRVVRGIVAPVAQEMRRVTEQALEAQRAQTHAEIDRLAQMQLQHEQRRDMAAAARESLRPPPTIVQHLTDARQVLVDARQIHQQANVDASQVRQQANVDARTVQQLANIDARTTNLHRTDVHVQEFVNQFLQQHADIVMQIMNRDNSEAREAMSLAMRDVASDLPEGARQQHLRQAAIALENGQAAIMPLEPQGPLALEDDPMHFRRSVRRRREGPYTSP